MSVLIRKRCTRCQTVAHVPARQRKCHVRRFGPGSFCCWGDLQREDFARFRPEVAGGQGARHVPPPPTPQETARKALGRLATRRAALVKQLATLAARLRAMGQQEARLARKAAMTDAEVAADREKRSAAVRAGRARRARRAMAVGGKVP